MLPGAVYPWFTFNESDDCLLGAISVSQNKQLQDKDYFDFLMDEANYPFTGWDFSHITATRRMVEGALTWSYTSKILMRLRQIQSLLDMGTGGGEFLSRLRTTLKCTTTAF